jgi:acetyl-CoA C-acetyltransferase
MAEAAIVAGARTGIGKAFRGALNNTHGATMGGFVVAEAVRRAGIDPAEAEDVIAGVARPEGATGFNIAHQIGRRAGLPEQAAGMVVNRHCASGLMAIGIGANRIQAGEAGVQVAAGVESVSLIQSHRNTFRQEEPWLAEHVPGIYWPMIRTADLVAERYGVSREAQDEYSLSSQQRVAKAQAEDRFKDEIVPFATTKLVYDKSGAVTGEEAVTLTRDEGNRADTTLEGLAKLKPVDGEDRFVTAGNASQLSDGAAAVVLMDADEAARRGRPILGLYRGLAVSGCDPEVMGIGPVFAVPKLLDRFGLKVSDIGLWELNEAFASQVLHCRDALGIPQEKLNVDGGGISIGHPFGMTGVRCTLHGLLEAKRRGEKYVVVTMCIGGGQGAAALFEVA